MENVIRRLRLGSGLVMFAYVTTHFLNLAAETPHGPPVATDDRRRIQEEAFGTLDNSSISAAAGTVAGTVRTGRHFVVGCGQTWS